MKKKNKTTFFLLNNVITVSLKTQKGNKKNTT